MPIHNRVLFIFPLLFALAITAHADTEIPTQQIPPEENTAVPLPSGTLNELEKLNTQTLLTEAQAQLANARASLQKAKSQYSDTSSGQMVLSGTNLPPGLPNPSISIPQQTKSGPPRILEISGQGRSLSARLMLDTGLSIIVRTGSNIPGRDLLVTDISASTVEVKNTQGQRHTLTFGE
ncbi:TPA: type IV pilus biogenesis protein PilP [Yersinia enterocolitica]|uniref:Type IV pilus biogenesis protein PilP n=1 Tax=Yersinia massiliensis TaxID=419257 RepID=A0ABM6V054_9GAMM|nr:MULTISPECIES: type IV pilus biogenesis protein PilP [Yersinia]AVX40663.1 type IV pilus biogenesis protein PilP [Yersinia massiliensis]MCB5310598.1 type IV pilus biogenesis protein PilP [Yersinia massiliensis]OWF71083.1 hypothetical protein B4902_20000 [Yersinia frederiksenii]